MPRQRGVSVGVEITGSAESFKAASEAAQKATAELKKKATAHSREIEQSFKMVTIGLAKIGGAILIAKKAFELYSKAMNTTEASSDTLEKQMGYLKGTVQGAMTTLFSGNWFDLITNIKNTAEATRDLAKAQDELEEAMARNLLTKGELERGLEAAKLLVAGETDKSKKKAYLQDAINYQKALTAINLSEIQKRIDDTSDYYRKIFGGDEKYWNYVRANIATIAKNYDYFYGNLENYQARLRAIDYLGPQSKAEETERHRLILLIDLLEDYKTLQDDLSKKGQFEGWLTAMGELASATAEGDQALIKLTKQITTLGVALGKQKREFIEIAQIYPHITSLAKAAFPVAPVKGAGLARGGKTLAAAPYENITIVNASLREQMVIVGELQNAFEGLFANIGGGFAEMAKSFVSAIKQMVAEMLAKAAIFTIFYIITGGTGALFESITGGKTFFKFLGLQEGGIATGPTLARVGEYSTKTNPEVIAPLSKLKGMLGGQVVTVKLTGKLLGRDIYMSGVRYAELLERAT